MDQERTYPEALTEFATYLKGVWPDARYLLINGYEASLYMTEGKPQLVRLIRQLGGKWKRTVTSPSELTMTYKRQTPAPGGFTFTFYLNREAVCEAVVVGRRVVAAVPEHEEDIVEWRCQPILKGDAS